MTHMNPVVAEVTARIIERSRTERTAYLAAPRRGRRQRGPARGRLACANLAHGFAACGPADKAALRGNVKPNIAIVSAYNDMLSAHQPFESFPAQLKQAVIRSGGIAQFAGGVPAMCDGITQGRAGMELSLFSRDVIAMSTAIALSHDMFDAALMLGVCDKIVPGLLIGALSFGHLPTIFVPAGPMTSGLPNDEKAAIRQRYAAGEVGREELLEAEAASYHSAGTCTFYGTANSNQMLMEVMGLHLPGASFVNPGTPLRAALTDAAAARATDADRLGRGVHPGRPDRRREGDRQRLRGAAGHRRLDQPHAAPGRDRPGRGHHADLGRLRRPVGRRAAAGAGLPQRQGRREPLPRRRRARPSSCTRCSRRACCTTTCRPSPGTGCGATPPRPALDGGRADLGGGHQATATTPTCCAAPTTRSPRDGGLRMLDGNLGRAVIKTSAVKPEHRLVKAPARVFDDQADFLQRVPGGELDGRLRRGHPLPGPGRQRHARAAQAHPGARRAAGPRPPGRAGHRRPDVRRVRQGPRRDPPDARGRRGGPLARVRDGDLVTPRRRRRRARPARRAVRPGGPHGRRSPTTRGSSAPAASCSTRSAPPSAPPTRAPACSRTPAFDDGERSMTESLLDRVPVIPVVVLHDVDHAVPVARALVAGGVPVIELTLRTPAALDAHRADRRRGARDPRRRGHDRRAGAGQGRAVRGRAVPGLPRYDGRSWPPRCRTPGCRTCPGRPPSREVLRLLELGYEEMKFFPAEASGGAAFLKAIGAPVPQARFCPTGGITAATSAPSYLALPNVGCVGGSWLTPADASPTATGRGSPGWPARRPTCRAEPLADLGPARGRGQRCFMGPPGRP